jgi:hypothetical protein
MVSILLNQDLMIESSTILEMQKINQQGHLIAIITNKGYKESLACLGIAKT